MATVTADLCCRKLRGSLVGSCCAEEQEMKPTEYPRCLILSPAPFNRYTGVGILLSNLFDGWPRKRLGIVFSDAGEVDFSICPQHYFLRGSPGSSSMGRGAARQTVCVPMAGAGRPEGAVRRSEGATVRLRHVIRRSETFAALRQIVRIERHWEALSAWVRQFEPSVIYAQASTYPQLRLVRRISAATKARICFHVMDDFYATRHTSGLSRILLRRAFVSGFKRLVHEAECCCAISEEMAHEYRSAFGKEWKVYYNAVDVDFWPISRRARSAGETLKIVFAGTVNDKNMSGIRELASGVSQLRASGANCELVIATQDFCMPTPESLGSGKGAATIVELPKTDEGLKSLVAEASVLVVLIDFSEEAVRRIRLSLLAKVAAYTATGIPILVYGPRGVATVDSAIRHGWGHVVSAHSVKALSDGLGTILRDDVLRRQLKERAQSVARSQFDVQVVRARFQEELCALDGEGVS